MADARVTYLDCLRGNAPVPHEVNGSSIFQFLMCGGMITFMVTFNGVRHSGLAFFAHHAWMYLLVFCIAVLLRYFVIHHIADYIIGHAIAPHLSGVLKSVAITVCNVLCMGPIMGAIMALLLNGPENYLAYYLAQLQFSLPFAMVVNFFIVGPAVKMLFNNKIAPAEGMGTLLKTHRYIEMVSRLFNS